MKAFVIWLTGLPGSGKTTIANLLNKEFQSKGFKSEILDGDEVRKQMSPELGFSKLDREAHARRVAYLGHVLSRNGIVTIVALISPFESTRLYARNLIGRFVEVWVKCSVETCRKRDPKGLYKSALNGKLDNLTGVQAPYEPPTNPELILDTEHSNPEQCVNNIERCLRNLRYFDQ
jgi:adenylylsulfate kinase